MRRVAELPKERSVQSKAQFLILEALRRTDEAHADAGKDKP